MEKDETRILKWSGSNTKEEQEWLQNSEVNPGEKIYNRATDFGTVEVPY